MTEYTFRNERRLLHLPERNREWQPEVDYFRKHGETRAEGDARDKAWSRETFESDAVNGLDGEPPEDIANTKGLGPKRARYARYLEWRRQVERELSDLERKKTELEAMVAALGPVKAEQWGSVRQTADFLLGRGEGNGEADAKVLADRVAVAQHRAEAAKVALQELEGDIDRARIRAARVTEREPEFLHPALIEVADEAGLGADYLESIARLRDAAGLIFGLIEVVHTYGGGFERPQGPITLPRINLPSVTAVPSDFVINNRGARNIWEKLADALRHDPRQNLAAFIKPPAPSGGYSDWPWK